MIRVDSPNHGDRRGFTANIVVLHYTAMPTAKAALERLCDPAAEVSAHYLIGRDGAVWHMVDEDRRAWHAGSGAWGPVSDVNSNSIGIELANTGAQPFPGPQMTALERLLPGILARWDIPPERVIAHSDLAPTRKFDPGPRFDWRRLARQGLSVWAGDAGAGADADAPDEAAFMAAARGFGYRCDDAAAVLRAFRLRFRPWAEGPLSPGDVDAITGLARRFPVDAGRASA